MSREVDVRAELPANTLLEPDGLLEMAPPGAMSDGACVATALEFLMQTLPAGLDEEPAPEFVPDPNPLRAASGARAVHVAQLHRGIPIFQAGQTVRFDADGTVTARIGNLEAAGSTTSVSTPVGADAAVQAAIAHLADNAEDDEPDSFGQAVAPPAVDAAGFQPQQLAVFASAECPTVFSAGPFGGDAILASLAWMTLPAGLRLAWHVIVTMPDGGGQYRIMVDANDASILYAHQLLRSITARGSIFRVDPSSERELVGFPVQLAEYGVTSATLPAGFPDVWLDAEQLTGNCVQVALTEQPLTVSGVTRDGMLEFVATDEQGDEQRLVNLFYFVSFMHDFFYVLGFREAEGNFQLDALGRGGVGHDPVAARIAPGPVFATANMLTPADGSPPTMNLGIVSDSGEPRHTALDATIVFHEYSHGVSNRLVGGRVNTHALERAQSLALGEGWGDYFACTVCATTVIGAWVSGQAGGVRSAPYDDDYPATYGSIGSGPFRKPHGAGEIWCATLLRINKNIGVALTLQLVVDAMKLSPANPSFLDMRDAILHALDAMLAAAQLTSDAHATALAGAWEAFAKFGMGPGATTNGTTLSGVVADYTNPSASPPPPPPATETAG